MLAPKLVGTQRLSHVMDVCFDPGFALLRTCRAENPGRLGGGMENARLPQARGCPPPAEYRRGRSTNKLRLVLPRSRGKLAYVRPLRQNDTPGVRLPPRGMARNLLKKRSLGLFDRMARAGTGFAHAEAEFSGVVGDVGRLCLRRRNGSSNLITAIALRLRAGQTRRIPDATKATLMNCG
jgi:hypothetical protein